MALPVPKNRAGMQFSCAAASVKSFPAPPPPPPPLPSATTTLNVVSSPTRSMSQQQQQQQPFQPDLNYEVWVCNSDGCVGQICFLSMTPEPSVSTINTVCSARIKCIAQVPGYDAPYAATPGARVANGGGGGGVGGVGGGASNPDAYSPLPSRVRSRTVSEPVVANPNPIRDPHSVPMRSHSAASGRNDLVLTVEEEEEIHEIMEHKELMPASAAGSATYNPAADSPSNRKKLDSDDEGIMSDPESSQHVVNGSGEMGNQRSGSNSMIRKDESFPDLRATTMWLGTEDGMIDYRKKYDW